MLDYLITYGLAIHDFWSALFLLLLLPLLVGLAMIFIPLIFLREKVIRLEGWD